MEPLGLPLDGTFEFTIGGQTRRFRLDLYALMRLEQLTGASLIDGQDIKYYLTSITRLVQLLWAMAVYEDPALTVEDTARWVQAKEIRVLQELMQAALVSSMPTPEPEDAAAGPPVRAARDGRMKPG